MDKPKLSRKRVRPQVLDLIHFDIHPEEGGGIVLEAFASYGPVDIPILAEETTIMEEEDERGVVVYEPDRDLELEEEAYAELKSNYPLLPTEKSHIFRVNADDLFLFAKEVLPELEYRYEIRRDDAVQERLQIHSSGLFSTWHMKDAGGGWFQFSIDWQSEHGNVPAAELRKAVLEGKPYIRDPDGGFIELEQTTELERIREVLKHAEETEDGVYRSRLHFAPELLAMLEDSQSKRAIETDSALDRFFEEVKEGKLVEQVEFPDHLSAVLRPYQKEGVSWLFFLKKYGFGGVLADEMGLGKTLQLLSFISMAHEAGRTAIVVCPKTLLLPWQEEAEKFTPELKTLVIDGTQDERKAMIERAKDYDLVIAAYSTVHRDVKAYLASGIQFQFAVLDEAQYIKNPATATAKAVKLLPSDMRIALTGTPLENRLKELWSLFDYLMPGFFGNSKHFTRVYEKPIEQKGEKAPLERLKRKINPFILRRTKASELEELPPKIEQTRHCLLTPEQTVVYARTLEEVKKEVARAVEEKGFDRSRIEILSALMKLRRICDHPALVDERLPKGAELSGKMDHVFELVRQSQDGGHKVLLFSQFTSMLDIIRDSLDEHGIGNCTIEGKTRDRKAEIDKFCKDPNISVFLLSLRAGGTGLTLTEADTVILFDPWWNPMVEQQAMDRAHRIGQSKTVNVYKLVTKGTVEEKVVDLQEKKKQLFEALVEEQEASALALTWEDVKGLLE